VEGRIRKRVRARRREKRSKVKGMRGMGREKQRELEWEGGKWG